MTGGGVGLIAATTVDLGRAAGSVARGGIFPGRSGGRDDIAAGRSVQEVFPLGIAEILVDGLSALAAFELLGRVISWTHPKGPLPRFRDHAS